MKKLVGLTILVIVVIYFMSAYFIGQPFIAYFLWPIHILPGLLERLSFFKPLPCDDFLSNCLPAPNHQGILLFLMLITLLVYFFFIGLVVLYSLKKLLKKING